MLLHVHWCADSIVQPLLMLLHNCNSCAAQNSNVSRLPFSDNSLHCLSCFCAQGLRVCIGWRLRTALVAQVCPFCIDMHLGKKRRCFSSSCLMSFVIAMPDFLLTALGPCLCMWQPIRGCYIRGRTRPFLVAGLPRYKGILGQFLAVLPSSKCMPNNCRVLQSVGPSPSRLAAMPGEWLVPCGGQLGLSPPGSFRCWIVEQSVAPHGPCWLRGPSLFLLLLKFSGFRSS